MLIITFRKHFGYIKPPSECHNIWLCKCHSQCYFADCINYSFFPPFLFSWYVLVELLLQLEDSHAPFCCRWQRQQHQQEAGQLAGQKINIVSYVEIKRRKKRKTENILSNLLLFFCKQSPLFVSPSSSLPLSLSMVT